MGRCWRPICRNVSVNELSLLTVTNTATEANTNLTLTYTLTMVDRHECHDCQRLAANLCDDQSFAGD